MTLSIRRHRRRPEQAIRRLVVGVSIAATLSVLTIAAPATADDAPNGYPYCTSNAIDPDGDGWGWENEASCVVRGSAADPGGGSSGGGTGGGGSTADCSATPVDARATQQAKNVLCYLYSQYGNHIISGQQESTWVSGADYEMNIIQNASGKLPAIRGMDMGDSPDFGSRALSWWNSGGIPMVGYHMGSPNQDTDGYDGSRKSGNISAALTSGTADYNRLTQRLDRWAAQLNTVQSGGGAVIIRPWHEAGGTWFWWSMEGGAQYKRLWEFTYNYLTNTKGLHNLVWLMPFNGEPNSSFLPSKSYYDFGGADTYANDHGPLTSLFNTTKNVFGSTVPIALHENGRIPDPAQLQSAGSRWVLFNTWHTTFISDTSVNPTSTVNSVYNSSYVVTRDELPNLK